jgi:uncharacterized phage infection (PIP) family protein YhgE
MDILHLVDRLEELFNDSRSVPFTHSVMVDEERILDIIDQMRVSIPEEIKKAQQLLAQRDRILAQAKEEADRTLSLARDKSEQMVERDAIVDAARARAEQMMEQIRLDNEETRREADEYAMQKLSDLEGELDRILAQVRNGIRTLQSEKHSASAQDQRAHEPSQ